MLRFSTRIVVALVTILLLAQAATLLIVDGAVNGSVHRQLGERLEAGERIWRQTHDDRMRLLERSVASLASDFAFREALATGDAATALSALSNHSRRIDADVALLLDVDGTLQTSTLGASDAEQQAMLRPLLDAARRGDGASGVVLIAGQPYGLALVPVSAPRLIGWVGMGSPFGTEDIAQYRRLSGLDAAITTRAADAATRVVHASSLGAEGQRMLAAQVELPAAGEVVTLGARHFYAKRVDADPRAGGTVEVDLLADVDEALQPYGQLKSRILLLASLAIVVALFVAVMVARSVTRPVARLASAARRIGDGDYASRLPVDGNDELSDLASMFNRMQDGIVEREGRILHQASHDSLTGLPNRNHALDAVDAALVRARDAGSSCAVLMLDLDQFKGINDTLGHAFGDGVLQVVAARLRKAVRGSDVLARLGGDEFIVVLEGAQESIALERAWGLVEALDRPLALPDRQTQVSVTASIGVALYPEHADAADTLLRRADIAMYEAKQSHVRVAMYTPGHDEIHLRQIRLMTDLRRARELGELSLCFQPKIDLVTRRVAHVEALLRWNHAEFGNVPPDEFIPLAEQSGLIHEITWFVLDEGLREAAASRSAGIEIGLAVNLSPLDLLDAQLVVAVRTLLARHAFPATELILEVTESTVMRDVGAATAAMHQLRALGVKMSIDDFGTGHSSLAQLRSLPVDEIKIDKSFVMQLANRPEDTVIVRSAIELGHNMGLKVIAEGVEHAGSLDILRGLNCDMVQGYLFSRPINAMDFRAWYAAFSADVLLPLRPEPSAA